MSEPSDKYLSINVETAKNVLGKTERQLRAKFEEIQKKTYNPNTKGYDYEKTVKQFLENYLGGAFDFIQRKGIFDVELKVNSIFKAGENEFDVVAIFKNAVPKLVYDPFIPYDAVAFIIEVKQTLNLSNLKADLQKLEKLTKLKVGKRFGQPSAISDSWRFTLDRPIRILFYYEVKASNEKVKKILEDEFKDSWDMLLVLRKDLLIANITLPLMKEILKKEKPMWESSYPLLKAMFFTCQSTRETSVDCWYLFWNLFRSIAP